MLHYRKDPLTVFKTYAYAAAAKMEGIRFFYFSPGKVDLERKRINGLFYENGEWVERETNYPDVVFNAGGTLTEKQDLIVDALAEELPFTSHPIGDKMSVYHRIQKGKMFDGYLIPSEEFEEMDLAFSYLHQFNAIIIKPLSGAKGEGIIYIEKKQDGFLLIESGTEKLLSKGQLEDWLNEEILSDYRTYLVQPFIQSKTKQGQSFDVRLHVQKDGEGKWTLTTMYPRIASKGIVANISSGGYTSMMTSFLEEQFGEKYFDFKRYLEVFAIQFSTHFDSLYEDPLDELGIDVGLDRDGKIWIYEVNWRPGQPVLFYLEMDVAKKMIQYATYLAKEHKRKKPTTNEQECPIEKPQPQVHEKALKKGIHRETISVDGNKFNHAKIEALLQRKHSFGKPANLSPDQEREVQDMLKHSTPANEGYHYKTSWNTLAIKYVLETKYGIILSRSEIINMLKRWEFSLPRRTYTLKSARRQKQESHNKL